MRLLFTFAAALVLCITHTDAFSFKLKDICRVGSYCNYFVGGIKRTIYGIWGENKDEQTLCLLERIQECTCYEMLILNKQWIPKWPRLDDVDVRRLRKQAAKIYHPDQLTKNYTGDPNEPFIFLEKCVKIFRDLRLRKDYRERLKTPLSALGVSDTMEPIARNIIYNVNIQFEMTHKDIVINAAQKRDMSDSQDKDVEKLYVFLDNTDTMKGKGLERGKRIFNTVRNRIFATPTEIHLIDSKSRTIVSDAIQLNAANVGQYVYNVWSGNGGDGKSSSYIWEYVWHKMQNQKSTDCEIIILTDGYNSYSTGHSTRSYSGVQGLNVLMENLKTNGDALCKTFVYCMTDECKQEVGKSYLDVAIATGGLACDPSNIDDCNQILMSSHAERDHYARSARNDHVRDVKDGKVKAIGWFDYSDSNILKGSQ